MMPKHQTIFLFLFLFACKLSFSTPQVRDILYWNGTTYHVYPFIEVEKRFDDAQLERLNEKAPFITTGNWRGYRNEFEICHDSLFLVSIKNDQNEDLMAYVIGSDGRIMMDNYSDTLYLGYGKTFFDEDFPTLIYESEMTVVFENGVVIYTKDNKNKSRCTELPHNIMKLHEYIYSSIRWEALDEDILAEKPQVYVNYSIDTLGRVCDVTLHKSSGYPEFDKEAMRVIAALPKFSAYFVCGKYLEKKFWQRIVFDGNKRPNISDNNGFSVLYEADTPFYQINKWRFPCIGFYNDAYTNCYLREPESLEDFLLFCYYCDSIDDGNDGLYDNCNKQTVENLQKCKQLESLQWINSEDELLIVIDNDTVWRHNALLPCNEDLKWLFQPHYYDKNGHYINLEENVNRSFKNSLREIGRPFFTQGSQEIHYYVFVYSNTSGIYPFCKEEDLDTSIKYFKDMERFLEKFVEENRLRKIIFIAPATEKIK